MTPLDARLDEVLVEAQRRGLVGPGSLSVHVRHALGYLDALELDVRRAGPAPRLIDLGSGGGLPGLVLAVARPHLDVVLLDASQRRTDFLSEAVETLALTGRATVVRARAEVAGHDSELRSAFDLLTARGFGRPAVTAECSAPFLRVGGRMAVSEPPGGEPAAASRWPSSALAGLGLRASGLHRGEFSYQILEQERQCPSRYPRRLGVPAKRPLF